MRLLLAAVKVAAGSHAQACIASPSPASAFRPDAREAIERLRRLEEQERRAKKRYQPILFVVAVCKADAEKAAQTLNSYFKVKTLLARISHTQAKKEGKLVAQAVIVVGVRTRTLTQFRYDRL